MIRRLQFNPQPGHTKMAPTVFLPEISASKNEVGKLTCGAVTGTVD